MVWADPPDGYYDNVAGLPGSELVDSIYSIIDNHTVLKYTNSSNDDWQDGQNINTANLAVTLIDKGLFNLSLINKTVNYT